jgi:DNA-binding CsgD family transcriptional regulator
MVVDEAIALDVCVRVEPQQSDADRLGELADLTDSTYVKVLAEQASALTSANPDRLLGVAERLAVMSAWWAAAEAATRAAHLLEQRHRSREAKAAARSAADYGSRCEGYRPSASAAEIGPIRLTKRENQVARLAAAGRSNQEIAEGMCLSRRTVANHLQHAYIKLGISDRASLAAALDIAT